MAHVFISYSRKNYDYAHKLADHLLANGFDVWIDDRRLDFGSRWVREIFKAVDECAAFVLIMSPESYESQAVEQEYLQASARNKQIFPLYLDGEVFPFFRGVQYNDVRGEKLPEQVFLDRLATFAPRGESTGAVVTAVPPKRTVFPLSARAVSLTAATIFMLVTVILGVRALTGNAGLQGDQTLPALTLTPAGVITATVSIAAAHNASSEATAGPAPANLSGSAEAPSDSALVIWRGPDSVAVCVPGDAALRTVELRFVGQNEFYTLEEMVGNDFTSDTARCWCLQQATPRFEMPGVCSDAASTLNIQSVARVGDWRNSPVSVSVDDRPVGECAAQPGELEPYSCSINIP